MPINRNPFPLGKVTVTAGVPKQIVENFKTDTDIVNKLVAKVEVCALPDNTGNVYLGYSDMNTTTLAGVIRILGAGDSWNLSSGVKLNFIDVDKLYIDADNTGAGVYSSVFLD